MAGMPSIAGHIEQGAGTMTDAPSDVSRTIDAMSDAFVRHMNAGEVGAIVDGFYAEDAALLPPDHEMVTGRKAVGDVLRGMVEAGMGDLSMETVTVGASGDLAYRIGRYRMGKPGPDRGKFIEVHRRQPDGSWRCVADIFNSDGSPGNP
jgi:ketosteroid isomerase-like protein